MCRSLLIATFAAGVTAVCRGEAPTLETHDATPLGTTGLTVNGVVHPHGVPTRYWFEYGPTAQYGSTTDVRDVPPRLAAYYREDWNAGIGGWSGGMSGKDLVHQPDGEGGFVRFSEPSGLDPNHIDGIGWLHLASYFYPGWHLNTEGTSAFLAAGAPDFRDARVSLAVRGNDWQPNGSELVWWSQTQSNDATSTDPRRPNWAYTGFSLNDHLQSGDWERVDYRLLNDSRNWTYAGNNVAQNRAVYEYGSIDAAQRDMDLDFFHLLAFVNPDQLPTGSIDFDDFEIAYRNYNLLLPSNGGQLNSSPAASEGSGAALTDGWRNGKDRSWLSTADPAAPLEFVYEFDRPVTIAAVQLHQHSEWPSRQVEVSVTPDGRTWELLFNERLPPDSPQGSNFAYLLRRNLSAPARSIRVRVLSGYRQEHWGLGEIEVFGTGAVMQPDDEPFHVNLDITQRAPGEQIHYRLVAENEHGRIAGADKVFTVPARPAPQIVVENAARVTASSATFKARVCPMGSRTESYFEYGVNSDFDRKTPRMYCGRQITPRSVLQNVTGLQSGTTYQYRLVSENENGTSVGDPVTFTTPEASEAD
jgi:hypothetical protein